MEGIVKFFIFLCVIPTLRAHTHGIKLIIILGLAYLLQQGYKKGNKKPKSLWRRSAGDPFNLEMAFDEPSILKHALDLDSNECAQQAVCRVGSREASGEKLTENESVLLSIIFWNGSTPPNSTGEEAFQGAFEYGRQAHGIHKLCHTRYKKCPYRGKEIDSLLASNDNAISTEAVEDITVDSGAQE